MQVKKILTLPIAICGLSAIQSTNAEGNSEIKFTGGASLSAYIQKQKSEISVSPSGCYSVNLKLDTDEANSGYTVIPDVTTAEIPTSKYAARVAVRDFGGDTSKYMDSLIYGNWSADSKMIFGAQGTVFAGISFGAATLKLGVLAEMPFANKEITSSFSSSENSNSSDNSSKSSNNGNSLYDVTEKKKLAWGFLIGADFAINDCFVIGFEGGVKRLNSEFDFSKANKNLLGLDGVPDNCDGTKISKEALPEGETKREEGLETVGTVKAVAWTPFLGGNIKFKFNKYLGIVLGGGWQFGKTYTLKNGSSKIENPDYTVKAKDGFYGHLGLVVQF